jgi:hypothetical protein
MITEKELETTARLAKAVLDAIDQIGRAEAEDSFRDHMTEAHALAMVGEIARLRSEAKVNDTDLNVTENLFEELQRTRELLSEAEKALKHIADIKDPVAMAALKRLRAARDKK